MIKLFQYICAIIVVGIIILKSINYIERKDTMSASVKVMLSYDYCHFEVCKGTDEDVTDEQINEMRKDVQRLADEAVRQYKKAKEMAANRSEAEWEKKRFLKEIEIIQEKPEGERTVNELAKLKQYEDETWQTQFDCDYDYEDDEF